ncbi:MAG TPA: hypothetical protein ACQGQH_10015 [Xylella sp.]
MRVSDVERGARMALKTAYACMCQPDLFDDAPEQLDFWRAVHEAALEQLQECEASGRTLCTEAF